MPDATSIFTKRDPATGAVLFDFTGHIHAEGLDLDENPDISTARVQSAIQWTDASTGVKGASLQGYNTNTPNPGTNTHGFLAKVTGSVANPNALAQLSLDVNRLAGGASTISAQAGQQSITLLDDVDRSNFLQILTGAKASQFTWGSTNYNILAGPGSAAVATITWATPFLDANYSPIAVCYNANQRVFLRCIHQINAANIRVTVENQSGVAEAGFVYAFALRGAP